jgi:hypothetical protein
MNTNLIDNNQEVDKMANQIANEIESKGGFGYQERVINLVVSEKELKKIEAAAFYNDYENTHDYVRDVIFGEIEIDKQRHLKGKESKDLSKLKK